MQAEEGVMCLSLKLLNPLTGLEGFRSCEGLGLNELTSDGVDISTHGKEQGIVNVVPAPPHELDTSDEAKKLVLDEKELSPLRLRSVVSSAGGKRLV
eukprot:7289832-Alexandrium_andersonii.AAC.1